MLKRPARPLAGFSLVELMVGITVGLLVLWGMSSVYVNSARGSQTTTTANQLNQDMRAAMDIMVNDIRRAGYWGDAAASVGINPFATTTTIPTISNLGAQRDCIVYSYDATYANATSGVTAGVDFSGFRLNDAGVLQTLDQAGSSTLTDSTTACANIAWQDLTDPRSITVTQLSFDTIGSQCIAFVPSTYQPTNSATFTVWTTAAGTGPACSPSASNAPSTYPNTATNAFVETRQVNITLKARSRTDATLPELTLTETVLVRSNRVITP